ADALNIISENQSLISLLSPRHAITPHPGEAARLLGKKLSDPFITANMLHALHCQALLKGASSVIHTDKGIFISSSGTSAMAKGGSGDVLTGMVGAFLAQGKVPSDALLLASEIHGLAGENAEKHTGCVSLLPSDIIDSLKEAFRYAYPE
ncbi:MAG: NAD(P)H-hydrate dehydratase, partial [Clostridia bacterium]|nr:NAD(P)H-hydrate dehydratase [Clostridia bacterium]